MLELNRIYNMDYLDGMKLIDDNSIDLIYTDMIYENLNFKWLNECKRILKSIGSIYVQTDYRTVAQLKLYMDNLFIFRNWIVWCYRGIARKTKTFQFNHDDILFYTKSDNFIWNQPYQKPSESTIKRWSKYVDENGTVPKNRLTPTMRKQGKTVTIQNVRMRDWWDDISVINYKEIPNGKLHPFQKPIELIQRIILASSNENDIVMDCFIGSGTTALACKKLNRNYLGFEINKNYYDISLKRLMNVPKRLELF